MASKSAEKFEFKSANTSKKTEIDAHDIPMTVERLNGFFNAAKCH